METKYSSNLRAAETIGLNLRANTDPEISNQGKSLLFHLKLEKRRLEHVKLGSGRLFPHFQAVRKHKLI